MPEMFVPLPKNMKCVPLGQEYEEVVEEDIEEEVESEDKLSALERQIVYLTHSVDSLFSMVKDIMSKTEKAQEQKEIAEHTKQSGKREIPEGTILEGKYKDIRFYCVVKDGQFYVGDTAYKTLSAAAKGVSGTRYNGLTFWHLNGTPVKEYMGSE